jgi:K+-sensing histidine kinase KdpD
MAVSFAQDDMLALVEHRELIETRAERLRSSILSTLSHDIRTPLTS